MRLLILVLLMLFTLNVNSASNEALDAEFEEQNIRDDENAIEDLDICLPDKSVNVDSEILISLDAKNFWLTEAPICAWV